MFVQADVIYLSMVTAQEQGNENFQNTCVQKRKHKSTFLRHIGSRFYAETGCRNVYTGKVFEWPKNPMEAKETIGDGCGREYADSQAAK